jgi:circadian clock protein KaiA
VESLAHDVSKSLGGDDRFLVTQHPTLEAFCQYVDQEKHHLDCFVLRAGDELHSLITWLYGSAILLPTVILSNAAADPSLEGAGLNSFHYHTAEVNLSLSALDDLGAAIEQAIAQFIRLSPTSWAKSERIPKPQNIPSPQDLLLPQQRRLSEKLKERLGYLGVYYKRDPQNFFRYLSPDRKQELLDLLKTKYRDIVLLYFTDDGTLNQRIDDFVNTAFFTDVSAAQIVEIHMELIDEFSKQLKLEGRSEEILLDYRLTLIDTIAHLCEMYRRSVPREA